MTKVVLPKENQSGVNEWADVEDNDKAIRDVVNGELEDDNIAEGANIDLDKLADGIVKAKTDLRHIRGSVNGGTGTKSIGEGYTSKRLGKGVYEITFEEELSSEPVITATSSEFNCLPNISNPSKKSIRVSFVNLKEEAQDTSFHFHVFG